MYNTTKADAECSPQKINSHQRSLQRRIVKRILIPGFGLHRSVKVYAEDYHWWKELLCSDYTFSKVTILSEQILSSGKQIEVKYEQSDPFAFQTRSLLGTRFDYHLNDDVNLGGTVLYYNERPLVSRNQIGTEPARNLQYGVDFNINKRSRMLTKIVDAIPFLETKEPSTINFTGEFAQLLPGTSNIVDGEGTAYIDDFENSATPYSLMSPAGWKLASTPETDDKRFDPSLTENDIRAGYKRAKLAWYQVDNQLYRNVGRFKPDNIDANDLKKHYSRAVGPQEIFPFRNNQQGIFYEQIFDVAYYPRERGPYNYNPELDNNGFLTNPETNWAVYQCN